MPWLRCGADERAVEPPATSSAARRNRIGLQLYTVRSEMEQDVDATLARVAAIGYTEVEFAGYFDHPAQQIRAMLDRNGLTAPAAHVPYDRLTDGWTQVLDDCAAIGHRYVVIPHLDEAVRNQPDAYARVAEALNGGAETARAAGIRFAYHNHQFEFVEEEGRSGFETLLAECEPSVFFELDVFWAVIGGQDPAGLLAEHPGRFPLIHIKDLVRRPEPRPDQAMVSSEQAQSVMTDVGAGTIDWARVLRQAEAAGLEHAFVEHDQPASPLASIQRSYEFLSGLRY